MTFISGVIIDRTRLMEALGGQTVRRFTATNLVQLGWILPLLQTNGRFVHVHDRCVLATQGNTGGYGLLTVFGVNFAQVARAVFERDTRMAGILISHNVRHYLPGLIWTSRTAIIERFGAERPWAAMRSELGSMPLFWILLVPIGRLPWIIAAPVFQVWRLINRLSKELHRLVPSA